MIVDTSAKMILSATISNQINLHPPINLGVILMYSAQFCISRNIKFWQAITLQHIVDN